MHHELLGWGFLEIFEATSVISSFCYIFVDGDRYDHTYPEGQLKKRPHYMSRGRFGGKNIDYIYIDYSFFGGGVEVAEGLGKASIWPRVGVSAMLSREPVPYRGNVMGKGPGVRGKLGVFLELFCSRPI